MSEEEDAEALEKIAYYAAEKAGVGDDLKRYAKTSSDFASAGGTIGTVVPGIGTAIGTLAGGAAGIVWEAGSDFSKWLWGGPKVVQESSENAERAFYAYWDLGAQEGTGLPYNEWWKLYVKAGRPPVELLLEAKAAERAAQRIVIAQARAENPPPPPPAALKTSMLVPLFIGVGALGVTIAIGKAMKK